MTSKKTLQINLEDLDALKWRISLREEVFESFISKGGSAVQKVFGDGSLFSPLLFGKFFDPSDAFPLWDFDSEILLSDLRTSVGTTVDWFENSTARVLRAQIPGVEKTNVQINIDKGKVMEICGLWKGKESEKKGWKSERWWEVGFVRRIELPQDANWKKMDASLDDDLLLEIRIPNRMKSDSTMSQAKEVAGPKESDFN